jgi:hypothetical protein
MKSSVVGSACLSLLLATVAHAKPKLLETIRPCDAASAEYANADAELKSISDAVGALPPAGDFAPLVERIRALARGRCFALLSGVSVDVKSALSLWAYWNDGGHARLRDALDWGSKGSRRVWVEPSVRKALTLETSPTSALRPLLCPARDDRCGAETRGWELRAEDAFGQAGALDAAERKAHVPPRSSSGSQVRDDDCTETARQTPAKQRFIAYRDCLDRTFDNRVALPIGHLRAPSRGWLVISGRRGHYDFCDETRAYDLASGAAFRVGTCSALALRPGGSVDHRATDDGRKVVVELGHLPLDALREAAWMLLLMDEVDEDVRVSGWGQEVPDGMEILEARYSEGSLANLYGWVHGGSFSSGETRLRWRIVREEAELKSGELTWPRERDEPQRHHALTLLKVAEEGFVAGCPGSAPPIALIQSKPRVSASKLDTDGESLGKAVDLIHENWKQALVQQRTCSKR